MELHTQRLEAVLHLHKEDSRLRQLREQNLRSQRSQSCEPLVPRTCEADSWSHQPDGRSQSYDTLLTVTAQNTELECATDPVLPQDDQLTVNEEGLPPLESVSVSEHDEAVSNSTIQFV